MSAHLTADWLNWPQTRAVMAALDAQRAGASRFVGGCVRNGVRGEACEDIDIATQLTPDRVIEAAKRAGLAHSPTGLAHGTVTVIADHKPYEVTTLRRDLATDGRRATIAFSEDWTEDAQRRDFRLNALYADSEGKVYDPLGAGLEDARAGRVVFIGDPQARIREDHLRILRFFRFHAWYGAGPPDSAGLAACAQAKDLIATLSAERVWKEVKKLLSADDPRAVVRAMADAGVLATTLPEASALQRFERLAEIESDCLLRGDALLRLAALIDDNPVRGQALALRLKLSNAERTRLVAALTPGLTREDRIVSYLSMRDMRRVLYRLGRQTFEDRVKLAWAGDLSTKRAMQWRALLAHAQGWTAPHFPLTGDQVILAGAAPGPQVGAVLREVEDWWIDADFTEDVFAIVERLKAVVEGLG